jgi:hypothetical protein
MRVAKAASGKVALVVLGIVVTERIATLDK